MCPPRKFWSFAILLSFSDLEIPESALATVKLKIFVCSAGESESGSGSGNECESVVKVNMNEMHQSSQTYDALSLCGTTKVPADLL